MMDTPTPTPEQLAAIRSARRASLLRKWTSGRHLALNEMAEISDLLPPELLAHPPSVVTQYARLQAEYGQIYSVTTREIKRWVAKGRAAKPVDPPPLDDPVAMLDWWPKHNKRRPPQRLLDAAERHRSPPPAAAPPQDVHRNGAAPSPAPTDARPPGDLDLTFGANIDRMRRAVADAHREYETALAIPDEGRAQNAMRRWSDLSEHLRKMEKDRAEVEQSLGDSLPKAIVARVLGEVHGTINAGLRAIGRRLAFPPELEQSYQAELDRLFALFGNIQFDGSRNGH